LIGPEVDICRLSVELGAAVAVVVPPSAITPLTVHVRQPDLAGQPVTPSNRELETNTPDRARVMRDT
jgi:hypothetical protein